MSNPEPEREFDLQPHPRILPVLGEITLDQWRCLAEFIDNSIDGFLAAARAGTPVSQPEINIHVPTADDPNAQVVVRDNAHGMTADTLENAVKAGWTSNDPINNLGMFGMGFNIATARLGRLTTVWTTRSGDPEWYGVEIDFDKMVGQSHYRTPMRRRVKPDPYAHGTEVVVQRLKLEQRQWFRSTANRNKLSNQLGRVYSAMLRPCKMRLGAGDARSGLRPVVGNLSAAVCLLD